MKKEYINPTMKVVKMKTRSKLLSGSPTTSVNIKSEEDAEVDGGYYEGI